MPGTPFGLGATWISPDLGNGVFSFRGQDWQLGPEEPDAAQGTIEFDGTAVTPDFNGSDTVDVSAPFTFTGSIMYRRPGFPQHTEQLSGGGIATVTMSLSAGGTAWQFVSARYEFEKHPPTSQR